MTDWFEQLETRTLLSGDWFSQNLRDKAIIATARADFADQQISRNDMIGILRSAEDGGRVGATELADLRKIVANARTLHIAAPAAGLAKKVVNADTANPRYQGGSLGNLFAGSSSDQMEKLVGKWFYGTDHPAAANGTSGWVTAGGQLYNGSPRYTDIRQGETGDCYLMSVLGETAYRRPAFIQRMITDNGDGTYTVRFYNHGVADYVTVDRQFPATSSAAWVYARGGAAKVADGRNVLWAPLIEKAYAQLAEETWAGYGGTNSYTAIQVGNPIGNVLGADKGIHHFTDQNSPAQMIAAWNSGKTMVVSSLSTAQSPYVRRHVYAVVGYDAGTGRFTLYNPWGWGSSQYPGQVSVSWNDLKGSFYGWVTAQ